MPLTSRTGAVLSEHRRARVDPHARPLPVPPAPLRTHRSHVSSARMAGPDARPWGRGATDAVPTLKEHLAEPCGPAGRRGGGGGVLRLGRKARTQGPRAARLCWVRMVLPPRHSPGGGSGQGAGEAVSGFLGWMGARPQGTDQMNSAGTLLPKNFHTCTCAPCTRMHMHTHTCAHTQEQTEAVVEGVGMAVDSDSLRFTLGSPDTSCDSEPVT